MKKIFAVLMAICLMTSALCITAFAADEPTNKPAAGTVLRVSALKKNGTPVVIKDYDNFEEGWEAAVDYAEDTETMKTQGYDRVVVDFYADWTANEDGEFGNGGDGFEYSTIHITEDIRVTLNLNNHTIDRDLSGSELDGEVIYVDEKADLIINNGTIKGGFSENGAGGIHIKNGANVTLNNVNIVGNRVYDDDGAGIAVYKGATLTMNGGSFKDNLVDVNAGSIYAVQGSAVYVENGTAIFDGVTFDSNHVGHKNIDGAAIYADKGEITVKNCTFEGNGIENPDKNIVNPYSIIYNVDGLLTVTNSNFTNNKATHLFYLEDSDFFMEGGKITQNGGEDIFYFEDSDADIKLVTITDNASKTIYVDNGNEVVTMVGCTLGNNTPANETDVKDCEVEEEDTLIFLDCTLGDTTFEDEDYVKVIYSGVAEEDAAISVTKLYKDGTKETTYYRFFEYGWNLAMEAAKTNTYERVIVDLLADWNSNEYGVITVPANAKMTINMNGHTINRGLTEYSGDGEVMYIASGAEIIINDGTITGGYSDNGAGGIHINDNAKVTLNNINVVNNKVINDDGAGIAVYDGATLIMNGGSISNNVSIRGFSMEAVYGGGIYIEDSTVTLTGVTIKDNTVESKYTDKMYGSAVYSIDSTVTLKDCTVEGNGVTKDNASYFCTSTIYADDSTIVIENTNFVGNGAKNGWQSSDYSPYIGSAVICVEDTDFTMTDGKFTDNKHVFLLSLWDAVATVYGVDFTGNNSFAMNVHGTSSKQSTFANCKFSAGFAYKEFKYDFQFNDEVAGITFVDCDFGDATFSDKNAVTFVGGTVSNSVGSIFGEGSLTMIFAILALIASGVSIFLVVYYNKKKAVPVATNAAADTENDEEE